MISLRRAVPDDVEFLLELVNDPDVEPFLGARSPREAAALLAEIGRSVREPEAYGRLVVEEDGRPAGSVVFERANERSRIVRLGGLAVHPRARGRGVGDEAARQLQRYLLLELGYHRLELEIYGFNEQAQRHAERAGFAREGVKRRAYLRHGDYADGVIYALLREDLLLAEHVARFNAGVRSGDFGPMLEPFAGEAELAFEGVPVGPFHGREAIAAAYGERPPDDELLVLESRHEGDTAIAAYAWARDPGRRAGELRLTHAAGRVVKLVVTFDEEARWS